MPLLVVAAAPEPPDPPTDVPPGPEVAAAPPAPVLMGSSPEHPKAPTKLNEAATLNTTQYRK
jgi:hypothetical protein